MSKYSELPLAGNLTVNGQAIYDRYTAEKEKLDELHKARYEVPISGFFG